MRLGEQIQEGQSLSNEILKAMIDGLERLKNDGTALATFKETFEHDYSQLTKKYFNYDKISRTPKTN